VVTVGNRHVTRADHVAHPQQRARRAALADAADGRGHEQEPLRLYLRVPLTAPQPCDANGRPLAGQWFVLAARLSGRTRLRRARQ
jgi:hypothetical protein